MGKWLTPDSLAPTNAHCRRVFIPGDEQMLGIISGTLVNLTYASNWEQFGACTPDETAQAMSTLYERFKIEVWNMIGAIVPCVTASTPPNCLECDGATYDGADYSELYAVIADELKLMGGQFHTPDLRGLTIIGSNSGYPAFSTGGEAEHTLNVDEMPEHTHADSGHSHTTGNSLLLGTSVPPPLDALGPNPLPASTGSASANLSNTGGSEAHNNLQPYMALRYVLIAG